MSETVARRKQRHYSIALKRRAVAAIARYGSVNAAAAALDIPRKTLAHWLHSGEFGSVLPAAGDASLRNASSITTVAQSESGTDAVATLTLQAARYRLYQQALRNLDLIEQAQDALEHKILAGAPNANHTAIALGILMQRTLDIIGGSKALGISDDDATRVQQKLAALSDAQLDAIIAGLSAEADSLSQAADMAEADSRAEANNMDAADSLTEPTDV